MALTDKLTAIANAIRKKTGKSEKLTLDQMPTEIESIQTGSSDVPFAFGGMNAVKVAEYEEQWTMADTTFEPGTSASTSAVSIKASIANRYTNTTGSPTYAYGDKDIVIVQKMYAEPTHGEGASGKAQMLNWAGVYVTWFSKRKTSTTSAKTTRQPYNLTSTMCHYYNTSGVLTRAAASYGFYLSPTAPTMASTTAASTYARVGSPALYYRASSTYESTANCKLVTDILYKWKVEVYAVDKDSTVTASINDTISEMLEA